MTRAPAQNVPSLIRMYAETYSARAVSVACRRVLSGIGAVRLQLRLSDGFSLSVAGELHVSFGVIDFQQLSRSNAESRGGSAGLLLHS